MNAVNGSRQRGSVTSRQVSLMSAHAPRRASWPPRTRAGKRELRRRRLMGLLRFGLFLLLIFLAVWAGVRVAHAAGDVGGRQEQAYVVVQGDTLWQIASRHYGDDLDPRRVVHHIRSVNGLKDPVLYPGDKLLLPALPR